MNDALKMQISAFVDGELPENEAELLMRRLNQDAAMRHQVAQYLAIGRHIRRDVELPGMVALRGRIAVALGEDSVPAAQSLTGNRSRFFKPALGFAVAASVAILAVVGLRQSVLPEADLIAPAVLHAGNDNVQAMTQPPANSADSAVLSEELRQMYRRHNATSADFGANGIITRLVTLELQGGELVEINPENRAAAAAVITGSPEEQPDGATVDGEPQSK
jgi:negative regulator of sigma E activity